MAMINEALATLDDITHWAPQSSCQSLQMLRLDQLHPVVSGNKWYKLKYNAVEAKAQNKDTLLTFGGGHSNHLVATAFAAKEWGLKSIGLVRGNYNGDHFTSTLRACEEYGMKLLPLSKSDYAAAKTRTDLNVQFPNAYVIPEGGANEAGIRGAEEIAALIPPETTDICVAVGTGTTLIGLSRGVRSLRVPSHLHGFYVAKDFDCANSLSQLMPEVIFHQVHDPRFGKWTEEALRFIRTFFDTTSIPLDVVYTSKMMMKVQSLLQGGYLGTQRRIVCIHTGGLQGNPQNLFS